MYNNFSWAINAIIMVLTQIRLNATHYFDALCRYYPFKTEHTISMRDKLHGVKEQNLVA
jgi:hypothetical protein